MLQMALLVKSGSVLLRYLKKKRRFSYIILDPRNEGKEQVPPSCQEASGQLPAVYRVVGASQSH